MKFKPNKFVVSNTTVENSVVQSKKSGDIYEGNIYFIRRIIECSCSQEFLDIGLYDPESKMNVCMNDTHFENLDFRRKDLKEEFKIRGNFLSDDGTIWVNSKCFKMIECPHIEIKCRKRENKLNNLINENF